MDTIKDMVIKRKFNTKTKKYDYYNSRTENGADIDGYIKKTNSSKSKLTGDFLFKKKDKKENSETEERPEVVNKEALA